MINDLVSSLQLILILISLLIIIYNLINGDDRKIMYVLVLINLCLLWMVLI